MKTPIRAKKIYGHIWFEDGKNMPFEGSDFSLNFDAATIKSYGEHEIGDEANLYIIYETEISEVITGLSNVIRFFISQQTLKEIADKSSYFRTIHSKVVEGQEFLLQLQQTEGSDGEIEYDYIISGPNWTSGFLKSQGYSEQEIFEYWDCVGPKDVNMRWEKYYERKIASNV